MIRFRTYHKVHYPDLPVRILTGDSLHLFVEYTNIVERRQWKRESSSDEGWQALLQEIPEHFEETDFAYLFPGRTPGEHGGEHRTPPEGRDTHPCPNHGRHAPARHGSRPLPSVASPPSARRFLHRAPCRRRMGAQPEGGGNRNRSPPRAGSYPGSDPGSIQHSYFGLAFFSEF